LALNNNLSLEQLVFPYYGGFIFTSKEELTINNENLVMIGKTINDSITYNNEKIDIKKTLMASEAVFADIFPTTYTYNDEVNTVDLKNNQLTYKPYSGERISKPYAYIPVFFGTNSEYDVAKGLAKAGFETNILPFVDIDETSIQKSIEEMVEQLDKANLFAISGGFSAGDEPDGSGKYIVNILLNQKVQDAINRFLKRDGLIIGICNGFQALIKSGLLPYGKIGQLDEDMPTLFYNEFGYHVSGFVDTKINKNNSPWTLLVDDQAIHKVAISHGEGRLMASDKVIKEIFANGQVFSQYVNKNGAASMTRLDNPNGSMYAIEGLVSPCGRILGKMAHTERYEEGCFLNLDGEKDQQIFESAYSYFQK
jgi:phosphoribosylformylglycinamidine synthase